MSNIQYTVRSIPSHVDRASRLRAEQQNLSLNSVIVTALEQAIIASGAAATHHELDNLIGSWVEDPEFDAVIGEFGKIDAEDWK